MYSLPWASTILGSQPSVQNCDLNKCQNGSEEADCTELSFSARLSCGIILNMDAVEHKPNHLSNYAMLLFVLLFDVYQNKLACFFVS
jgi:hypothetical protein